jgi:hypothetical protein
VGDGTKVRLWYDLWFGDTTLKEFFPVLFGIARIKDAFVVTLVEFLGGVIQWNVSFTKAAHNWDVKVFASFFEVLHLVRVRQVRRTSCGGSLQKRVCLVLNLSTVSSFFFDMSTQEEGGGFKLVTSASLGVVPTE